MKKPFILLAVNCFIAACSFGQENNTENLGFNPPSLKWRKINVPTGKIIYPQGMDSIAFRIAGIMNYQREHDESIVGPGKTKKVPVIIQNLTVFPEGFSTPAPWRNEYFISPPQTLFQGPTPWVDLLSIHEYRHTQQFHMAKGGFTWLYKPLMGQTGWLLSSLFNEPLWFREGDAVTTETLLTKAGRGRLPRFNMETKALLLSGYKFDYEKASYGISFKDYVPNPYRPGFYMTSKLRRDISDDIWQKILHDTYHKGLIYSFNHALKKNAGLSSKNLYDTTMAELDSFWRDQNATLVLTSSQSLTKSQKNNYVNYRFPHFLPDGSVISLKNSFEDVQAFTIIDSKGNEKQLFKYGLYTDDHLMFAAEGNLVTWAEAGYDARWGNKTYSNIKIYNLKTGVVKKLTKKTRYFAPAPSHDGTKIAAVKVDVYNKSSLVILNSEEGSILKEWPSSELLTQPRWSSNDEEVLAIAVNSSGNSLLSINANTGTVTTLIDKTAVPLLRPFANGNYVYFTAAYSGIDNIYALHRPSGKLFQVSSVRFGAYEPALSLDGKKLVYSSYSAKGYQLEEMDMDTSLWKEVNPGLSMNPSQPYVGSVKNNELTAMSFPQQYSSKKYHALTSGLLYVYGWFPYVGVDQYGVQFLAQNIMNTLRGSITPFYNSSEKVLGTRVDLKYAAFYPVLHIGVGYQTKRAADILDPTVSYKYKQSWKEKFYTAGLALPLNLSSGNYRTRLTIGGEYGYYDVDFLDSTDASQKFRNTRFNAYTTQMVFSRLSQRARRNVQSPWGQQLTVNYEKAISDLPERLTVQGRFYFPGFLKTHSFNVQGAYNREEVADVYRFTGTTVMPRGYDAEPFENSYVAGVNYELPLWYPDIAAGGLAFFQRLRTNLFYDHSIARRMDKEYHLNSTGAELFLDLRALRLFGMTIGIRYSAILNKGLINTTPFQFFVSRFELQN
jgi:hypothetical protein